MDWFEAMVKLGGVPCKLQFFAMRSMGSGDSFHRAYTNATQQALREVHEHALDYFVGVFKKLRYDNMALLVQPRRPLSMRVLQHQPQSEQTTKRGAGSRRS